MIKHEIFLLNRLHANFPFLFTENVQRIYYAIENLRRLIEEKEEIIFILKNKGEDYSATILDLRAKIEIIQKELREMEKNFKESAKKPSAISQHQLLVNMWYQDEIHSARQWLHTQSTTSSHMQMAGEVSR